MTPRTSIAELDEAASTGRERVLVNFFYAHNVGHAVEALHYCLGHYLADPSREICVALNAEAPVGIAGFCPFVSQTFAVDHPLLQSCPDSAARQSGIPRRWDWVLDDFRRRQAQQLAMFPGLRDYYATSYRLLTASIARTVVTSNPPGYVPHQQLRLELPATAQASARKRLSVHGNGAGASRVALMPAGSGDRALYPSTSSWLLILDALSEAFPGVGIALIGKHDRDGRTTTSLDEAELAELLKHPSGPIDCFGCEFAEQLAVIEASDLFLAPHTGFGLAALAVGTPWLALSGGRWFEYFFNRVPFRSIIPDTERYPCFTQFDPAATLEDGDEGARTPSMSHARVREDLGRIVAAANELLCGSVTYERALKDYFTDLVAAHAGERSAIWSIDNVHREYL